MKGHHQTKNTNKAKKKKTEEGAICIKIFHRISRLKDEIILMEETESWKL